MHSFVIVIGSANFGAQKRRKYAKSIGVNRSAVKKKSIFGRGVLSRNGFGLRSPGTVYF